MATETWIERIRQYLLSSRSKRIEDVQHDPNPLRPATFEIATLNASPIYQAFIGQALVNPDPIIGKHSEGKGIGIFEKMFYEDFTIRSEYNSTINAVLAFPRTIEAVSEDPMDIQIADFCRDSILDLENFDDVCESILLTRFYGYSVHEVLWQAKNSKWVVEDIKQRAQDWFRFHKDPPHALLFRTKYGAWIDGYPVPAKKFLVSVYQGKDGNPYGDPIARTLYWPWYFKKNSIKFWDIFNEVFGSPTKVGKYPKGATDPERDDFESQVKNIMNNNSLTMPADFIIELLEATRSGTVDTYERFLAYLDGGMTRVIAGSTLTSQEGDSSGFQSLGKQHAKTKSSYVAKDARLLEGVINTLIHWLVDFNYANVKKYPKFKVGITTEEESAQDSLLLGRLQRAGLKLSEKYIRKKFSMPAPESSEDELIPISTGEEGGPGGGFGFTAQKKSSLTSPQKT